MCSQCGWDWDGDEREELPEIDIAPSVGFPDLEAASDSRMQQAIASAYAAMVQRTISKEKINA